MENKTKKVAWNASEGIIMEISNRRSLANTYFIQGKIRKAFSTLIAIKQSVIQSFNDDERTELGELEEKFGKISWALYESVAISFNSKVQNAHKEATRIGRKLYSQYNDRLMDLLEDRGYLIGEQSDSSSMKF
jgi:hypothetical protein